MSLKYQAYAYYWNLDEPYDEMRSSHAVGPERTSPEAAAADALTALPFWLEPNTSSHERSSDRQVLLRVAVVLIGAPNVELAKPLRGRYFNG